MTINSKPRDSILTQLRSYRDMRFNQWTAKRFPPRREVELDQKTIFILPTSQGFFFFLVLFLLFIAAINYENNMIFSVVFLLASMFVVSILHTYRNLAGLTLAISHTQPVFLGEKAEVEIALKRSGKRLHEALDLRWQDALAVTAEVVENEETMVKFFVPAKCRGWYRPGRMHVSTRYPVGLLRAWSTPQLDAAILVYPKPIKGGALPASVGVDENGDMSEQDGGDEYYGMRDYQAGDPLRRVAWKQFGRSGQMYSKQYKMLGDSHHWIDWYGFRGDAEMVLSQMCYWALTLEKRNKDYGLVLPAIKIQPHRGDDHLRLVLRHLALFDATESMPGSASV